MKIEDEIKRMILDRYGSLNIFADEAGVSYTTLLTIMKRGFNKANVTNVIRICETLGISTDALAQGRIEEREKTEKRDVCDILAEARAQLISNDALMFNGEPADEESIQSILDAIEIGVEMARRKKESKK